MRPPYCRVSKIEVPWKILHTACFSSPEVLQTLGEVSICRILRRIRISSLKCYSLSSDSEKAFFCFFLGGGTSSLIRGFDNMVLMVLIPVFLGIVLMVLQMVLDELRLVELHLQ